MGRASSQPKSLSISSSAPSSTPFSGAVGPAPTRLNMSANTLLSFSTAPFAFSCTSPRAARWAPGTTAAPHPPSGSLGSIGLGHAPSCQERLGDRHAVGVLEISAHGEPARDAGHAEARRLEQLLQVRRCNLAFHRRIGRDDDLPN